MRLNNQFYILWILFIVYSSAHGDPVVEESENVVNTVDQASITLSHINDIIAEATSNPIDPTLSDLIIESVSLTKIPETDDVEGSLLSDESTNSSMSFDSLSDRSGSSDPSIHMDVDIEIVNRIPEREIDVQLPRSEAESISSESLGLQGAEIDQIASSEPIPASISNSDDKLPSSNLVKGDEQPSDSIDMEEITGNSGQDRVINELETNTNEDSYHSKQEDILNDINSLSDVHVMEDVADIAVEVDSMANPTLSIDESDGTIPAEGTEPANQSSKVPGILYNDDLPPIFVLNLDRSIDRWHRFSAQLEKQNLLVNRFPAVDGRALSSQELEQQTTFLARFFNPKGVLGCYLSHRKLWQYVVDNDLSSVIVFEDDVTLATDFKRQLRQNLEELEAYSYDVAFIGAIGCVNPHGKDTLQARWFSTYMGGSRPFRRLSKHLYQAARPAGTHAYLVTKEGAKKLLKLCPKAVYHVDLDAWRHRSLNMITMDPMLAHQTFDSSVLTDVDATYAQLSDGTNSQTSSNGAIAVKRPSLVQRLSFQRAYNAIHSKFSHMIVDQYTKQPLSHVLAEPMLQFGPHGWVLTVERHCGVLVAGFGAATAFQYYGYSLYAKAAVGLTLGFFAAVRGVIWMLMNVK